MGWLSDLNKKRKKITKKLTPKFLRSTISKIGDLGMKVVNGIGKVVNKLGPLGMMAMSIIAPYAIGAMINMGGVIGAIGTGLQTVGNAVGALMKAPGQLIGAGVDAVGGALSDGLAQMGQTALSEGVTTITQKLTSVLGFEEGSGVSDILSGVKESFADITFDGENMFAQSIDAIDVIDLPAAENMVDPATAHGLDPITSETMEPITSDPIEAAMRSVEERDASIFRNSKSLADLDPFTPPDQMQNIDDSLLGRAGAAPSFSETAKKVLDGASGLMSPQMQVPERSLGKAPGVAGTGGYAAGRDSFFGPRRKPDFRGQEKTGVATSDDLLRTTSFR